MAPRRNKGEKSAKPKATKATPKANPKQESKAFCKKTIRLFEAIEYGTGSINYDAVARAVGISTHEAEMRHTQLMASIRASLVVQQTPSQLNTDEHDARSAADDSDWSSNDREEKGSSSVKNDTADTDDDETLKKDGEA